jgi:sulfate adenylyltransferase
MQTITANREIIQESLNIIDQVYYPLKGFLNKKDLFEVLYNMRLKDDRIWPMPIVFDISKKQKEKLKDAKKIMVKDKDGRELFVIKIDEIYKLNKLRFIKQLFKTTSEDHPGVLKFKKLKDYLIGGEIVVLSKKNILLSLNSKKQLRNYVNPEKTKEFFLKKSWGYVSAFQTRNPPHRSHEHLQKQALAKTGGLFINPIIGEKKPGDFKNKHIIEAYKILIKNYFNKNQVFLATFHTFMRYAGPKEAVFHALVRRNFGCTHMIIGRDHAGVGKFYHPFEAQEIFDQFDKNKLGIEILKFKESVFCKTCKKMVLTEECDHNDSVFLSGTELRDKLLNKKDIPEEFMRGEVSKYLVKNRDRLFV